MRISAAATAGTAEVRMKCTKCDGPMLALLTSLVCARDCDRAPLPYIQLVRRGMTYRTTYVNKGDCVPSWARSGWLFFSQTPPSNPADAVHELDSSYGLNWEFDTTTWQAYCKDGVFNGDGTSHPVLVLGLAPS